MFYGLLELLAYSVMEFQRLSPAFPLWLMAVVGFAVLPGAGFLLAGRSVYTVWHPPPGLGILAGLGLLVSALACLLLFSSPYIRPAVVAIIDDWQQTFLNDRQWNDETFSLQYQAVSALRHADGTPLEDFTARPSPAAGGSRIPVSTQEARTILAEIDSGRVAEHFQRHLPLLARLLWSKERPLPDAMRRDMETFFADNPGTVYEQNRAVQLAATEMQSLLAGKIGRIVLTIRIAICTALAVIWLPLFGLAIYDAWKKLEPSTERL